MGKMDEQQQVTSEGEQASRSSRNPSSGGSRSGAVGSPPPSSPQFVINSEDVGRSVAEQFVAPACSPVSGTHDVWGVLTAISDKAKSRSQGPQILLHNSEHILGRLVKDPSCQFDSLNVSAKHCTIFRKRFKAEGCIPLHGTELVSGDRWLVYIKDSSSNGTFINCQKLKRDSPEARIKDGDIISLVNAPEHENAFAFLYQEIKPNALNTSMHQPNGSVSSALKRRKSLYEGEIVGESNSGDSKRVKGLGIGGSDGPVSLDDVRRLQRSNEELRNQLEAHLLTIEKLRAESRAAAARHDAEIKELRETLSAAFLDQIQDLRTELEKKEKELDSSTSLCAQQQSRLEDRNRSLAAAIQSRKDADEVIKSQKLNIVELKEQLEDERSQRRNERVKAEADLKAALDRVRSEGSEELKRQSESSAQQLREHLEMINKLQEADRESRSLVEALRSKLEDTRETLVKAERTSRSLELRLQDEEASLAMAIKRITEKEQELQCATKEMQNEKAAKEEALARLSTVEVEMETAIHDLSVEQQRLQGARERIVLRETQLRAFHSTAEEVAMLQQKQQEQLKEMMRVLEDGDDECHVPTHDHYNGNTTTKTRVEVDTQMRDEDNNALQESEQRMDNHTVNNDEEKEVAGDADSQTTASNFSAHAEPNKVVMEYGDGDTQVDDSNEFVDASRDAQAVLFPDDEQKGSEPSVPMGTEAGYTQVLEIESNYRYMNETQVLGNGRDEGVQTKFFAGYTQLLDTQSKLGSGKYLNETQLLDNGRDDNISIKGRKDGGGNTEFMGTDEQAGVPGGETLLLEDENDTEMGEWGRRVQAQLKNQETKMSGIIRESELASPPDKRGVSIEPAIEHGVQGSEAWNQVDVASGKNVPATTAELMTSEVAGSWAYSTPASVHCDDGGWSQSQARVGGPERGSSDAHLDFDASQSGRGIKGMHPPQQKGRLLENSHGSLSPRTTARHDKERRDLNVMLDIVAPEFSRLQGLGRVMETAPDSEDHTGEEEEEEEEDDDEVLKSDEDSAESEPLSQSVSVSARY